MAVRRGPAAQLTSLTAAAYTIPTDFPEADGTYRWDSTTIVIVTASGGGQQGLGYTYTDASAAGLISGTLAPVVSGRDLLDIPGAWEAMARRIRNLGRPGIVSTAIAAVDAALWDLKAKLLDLPLALLLGRVRDRVMVYGSGGFTSYDDAQLARQLGCWAEEGLLAVKMKVGSDPDRDLERVRVASEAVGDGTQLFVDANGAYDRAEALAFAEGFSACGVSWFEEPVSSDDLEGLHFVRDRAPAGMDVAAGEYGYDSWYFRRMLEAEAVDVLQADVTRCGGITGFLRAGALCEARCLPLSAHCAPALSLAPCCALPSLRHIEYFHDHVRIEDMLFEGTVHPRDGFLQPDLSRPGLGLEFKASDAERYKVAG